MDLLSEQLEQLERQFDDSEYETAQSEGIKNLAEAVLVRDIAELRLIVELLKAR